MQGLQMHRPRESFYNDFMTFLGAIRMRHNIIWESPLTVRCEGEAVQVTHPDPDGAFRFALGGHTWGGLTDTGMSNSPTMTINPGNAAFACEIRVSEAGFVSQALEMQQGLSFAECHPGRFQNLGRV